ncbi:MAG: adenylate kinase family enzyme [Myxococcota bacterium]|jgi:adenylate kinase family enzyme
MTDHRRWLLLGSGGAGKTTLAAKLSQVTGLPVIHLDQHFWQPGWVESTPAVWSRKVADLCEGDEWIMDGNYSGTLDLRIPRAQAAILLDPPTIQCLWGVVSRGFSHLGKVRPDFAEGCEERLPDLQFLHFVASYKWRSRPRVLKKIEAASHIELFHVRSRREAGAFLETLAAERSVESSEPRP